MTLVQNSGPRLNLTEGLTVDGKPRRVLLERGLNKIDDNTWEGCKKNHMTQVFLREKMIRVMSGDATAGDGSVLEVFDEQPSPGITELSDFGDMSAKDVVVAVKQSSDEGFVLKVLESDPRLTVQAAARARLDALQKQS
jgi:hypothetical protein